MTRKKVDLSYIANDSKRKATLKKRKNGLIKKIDEISTLCGIEACAIIYTPNDPQPEVWPSEWEVHRVLSKFKRVPELEQSKKMLNQESFLRQRIIKAQEQLKKQKSENRKKEMTQLMFEYLTAGKIFDNASMMDLNDLSCLIDQNLKEIERNINGQVQEVAPMIENAGEIMNVGEAMNVGETMNGGEQAVHMNHVQGLETNVDAMHKQNWAMDFINGGGSGSDMLPFGDVNAQNGFWANPYIP
ncbi:agamous-like MADS-box protein AGL80 [Abrus precatorius]|uniref:Agamous-like MADS-box protein AGL80 n=1 Tax=Abrus precatorius TaxID=3816 RepID=A0A8B8K1B9_ABRPR|nr:agamous-like MADS-box protein AGL80 [Abrus precatorius]